MHSHRFTGTRLVVEHLVICPLQKTHVTAMVCETSLLSGPGLACLHLPQTEEDEGFTYWLYTICMRPLIYLQPVQQILLQET